MQSCRCRAVQSALRRAVRSALRCAVGSVLCGLVGAAQCGAVGATPCDAVDCAMRCGRAAASCGGGGGAAAAVGCAGGATVAATAHLQQQLVACAACCWPVCPWQSGLLVPCFGAIAPKPAPAGRLCCVASAHLTALCCTYQDQATMPLEVSLQHRVGDLQLGDDRCTARAHARCSGNARVKRGSWPRVDIL